MAPLIPPDSSFMSSLGHLPAGCDPSHFVGEIAIPKIPTKDFDSPTNTTPAALTAASLPLSPASIQKTPDNPYTAPNSAAFFGGMVTLLNSSFGRKIRRSEEKPGRAIAKRYRSQRDYKRKQMMDGEEAEREGRKRRCKLGEKQLQENTFLAAAAAATKDNDLKKALKQDTPVQYKSTVRHSARSFFLELKNPLLTYEIDKQRVRDATKAQGEIIAFVRDGVLKALDDEQIALDDKWEREALLAIHLHLDALSKEAKWAQPLEEAFVAVAERVFAHHEVARRISVAPKAVSLGEWQEDMSIF
ncbi:hypothetical protein MMC10_001382 [Thelotrema lepadinum]|nr:hypothetical protein [Thelotrema lepadinum]